MGRSAPILPHSATGVKRIFTFFATFLIWLVFLPDCPYKAPVEIQEFAQTPHFIRVWGNAPRQNPSAVSKRSAQTKCQIEVLKRSSL
ncbi:MAG TPA: hypothetical protein DCM40_39025 [Maribacter sp.]|nr:hypothetical protein [Maribacter sp.]